MILPLHYVLRCKRCIPIFLIKFYTKFLHYTTRRYCIVSVFTSVYTHVGSFYFITGVYMHLQGNTFPEDVLFTRIQHNKNKSTAHIKATGCIVLPFTSVLSSMKHRNNLYPEIHKQQKCYLYHHVVVCIQTYRNLDKLNTYFKYIIKAQSPV